MARHCRWPRRGWERDRAAAAGGGQTPLAATLLIATYADGVVYAE